MDIEMQALDSGMALQYVDFFENRAFSDGNINKGCYCVWHHWTEKHEYERSLLPAEERSSVKRNYAIDLIEQDRLHGFAAWHDNKIIGFCNADLKNNYFRMSKEKNPDSWIGIDNNSKVMAIVCFTVDPNYRGKGIAKKLLSYACDFASHNGYDYIESYPSNGEFNPNLCCGNRSMYESQGFTIINVSDGIVARKQVNGCEEHNV